MEFGMRPDAEPVTVRKPGPQTPVVVPAPSHDGAPCFATYSTDDRYPFQPLYAIIIYATMLEAADPDFVRDLALKIHTGTILERTERFDEGRDRIEVFGLPPPAAVTGQTDKTDATNETDETDETEEACVARCVAHYMAEVAARTATGQRAFFLPPTRDSYYNRRMTIIRSLHAGWEDVALFRKKRERPLDGRRGGFGDPWDETPFPPRLRVPDPLGTILDVHWEPTNYARDIYKMEEMQGFEPEPVPEQTIQYVAVVRLAAQLADFRSHLNTLSCYVSEGKLDTALRSGLAAATATKAKEAQARATELQTTTAEAEAIAAEAAAAKAEASWQAFSAALAAREEAAEELSEKDDAAQVALEKVADAEQNLQEAVAADEKDRIEAARAKLAVVEAKAAEAEAVRDKAGKADQAVKAMITWMPAP